MPTGARAEWGLLAIRVALVAALVFTFLPLALWNLVRPDSEVLRWSWLWTLYAAVPLAAVVVAWRQPRPLDFRFVAVISAASMLGFTGAMALVSRSFVLAAVFSVLGVVGGLAMPKAGVPEPLLRRRVVPVEVQERCLAPGSVEALN